MIIFMGDLEKLEYNYCMCLLDEYKTKRLYLLIFCFFYILISCQADSDVFQQLFKCSKSLISPYGICTHINRVGSKYEFDTREQDMKMIGSVGGQWIRTDFDWSAVWTPRKDSLTFKHLEKVVNSVLPYNQNILGILTVSHHPKLKSEWEYYVTQTTSHFKPTIRYWEIVNEADLKQKQISTFGYSDYVRQLQSSYKIIKKVDKRATVLFSGIADVNNLFIDSIFKRNVSEYFDVMNIHHYANGNDEPEIFVDYFRRVKAKLNQYKIDKSVWLTETGCTTAPNWATEEMQSWRLPRIFLISFACGIDKVFWYKSRSSELVPNDSECYFGLWHKDYTPKLAYYAYRTLIKMCPNKSTRPVLVKQGSVYIAFWKQPNGRNVYALWSPKEKIAANIVVKGKYNCYDIYGREILMKNNEIDITSSIKYWVGANKFKLFLKNYNEDSTYRKSKEWH